MWVLDENSSGLARMSIRIIYRNLFPFRFLPLDCDEKIKQDKSTKVYKVTEQFDFVREKAVIYNDGMTWVVAFKDKLKDGMPPPPDMYMQMY